MPRKNRKGRRSEKGKQVATAKPKLAIAEDIDHIPEATKKVDTPRATEHAPNVKIHAERATPEKQVSRGETKAAVQADIPRISNLTTRTARLAKPGAGKRRGAGVGK